MIKNRKISVISCILILLFVLCLPASGMPAKRIVMYGAGDVFLKLTSGTDLGVASDTLESNALYTGEDYPNEIKTDDSVSFGVTDTSDINTMNGETLSFDYTGAKYDPDDGAESYVSALISDKPDNSGDILYYGRLKKLSSAEDRDGNAVMKTPSGLTVGTPYYIILFSETVKSVRSASAASPVKLTIFDPYITTKRDLPETTVGVEYASGKISYNSSDANIDLLLQGSLPDGMTFNAEEGKITGAPTKDGSYTFNIKAQHAGGAGTPHVKTFYLKVNPAITVSILCDISGENTVTVTKGTSVTLTASASGGTELNASGQWYVDGAEISGETSTSLSNIDTSATGTHTYEFKITDSVGAEGKGAALVTVREPVAPSTGTASSEYDKKFSTTVSVEKNDGDYPFEKISENGLNLVEGTDYTRSPSSLTFLNSFLNNLSLGVHVFKASFSGYPDAFDITITVYDTSLEPEVSDISVPDPVKTGASLSLVAPTVNAEYRTAVTDEGWRIRRPGASTDEPFDPASTLLCADNGSVIYYYATNEAGTAKSNEVTVTVNHNPSAEWSSDKDNHWHQCPCGEIFDLAPHTRNSEGVCTVCGQSCHHVFTGYVPNNDATCTHDGTKTRKCVYCGYSETIPDEGTKKGHDWSDWQFDDDYHWKVCTRCGVVDKHGAHSPGPEATESEPQRCTVCGMIIHEILTPPVTTSDTTPAETTSETTPVETTLPSAETTLPSAETTPAETTLPEPSETTGKDGKISISIELKDGSNLDSVVFIAHPPLDGIVKIIVNGESVNKSDYTLSPDKTQITVKCDGVREGKNTILIETFDGIGELEFELGKPGPKEGGDKFPYWLLWVAPYAAAILFVIICVIIAAIKRNAEKKKEADRFNE